MLMRQSIFALLLSAAGIVDLFAVSFSSYSALHALQADTFTLATMTFLALAPGTSSLAFVQNSSGLLPPSNEARS